MILFVASGVTAFLVPQTTVTKCTRRRARGTHLCRRVVVVASSAAGARSGSWSEPSREPESQQAAQSQQQTSAHVPADEPTVCEEDGGVEAGVTENAAALQVDDGSLSAGAATFVPVPRRLVRRRFKIGSAREAVVGGVGARAVSVLTLVALFVIWYGSNALFNVYNKRVLAVFPYPLTCTVVQFAVGAASMAFLWITRLKRAPSLTRPVASAVAPLAACHAAGFLLTNMSLGKVSVAFTHTVKATEPFFSAALTPSILGDIPTWGIIGSLVPIVLGVALASANDTSFNWVGFLCAIGSNIALQARNVLSKKLMSERPQEVAPTDPAQLERDAAIDSLDNVNLFAAMTLLALVFLSPVALLWEGAPLLSAAAAPATTGMAWQQLWTMLIAGGALRCLDVLSSYMILQRVSPVTHSVGNCVKRAVVIGVSIIIFKTSVTCLSMFGTALALAGVLLYSVIVAACKQNTFGPESPVCKPVYEKELELTQGGGI